MKLFGEVFGCAGVALLLVSLAVAIFELFCLSILLAWNYGLAPALDFAHPISFLGAHCFAIGLCIVSGLFHSSKD